MQKRGAKPGGKLEKAIAELFFQKFGQEIKDRFSPENPKQIGLNIQAPRIR